MKKIIARQVDPAIQESYTTNFYDFNDIYPGVIIDGNKRLNGYTTTEYDNIVENFESAVDEYENLNEFTYSDSFKNHMEIVDYFFPKDGGYSKEEYLMFCKAFEVGELTDKVKVNILSVSTGLEYSCKQIQGHCQSDWNTCYYPLEHTDIRIVESDYFNTGTEWIVDEGDVINFHIYVFENQDIRKTIAEATETATENVTLLAFDGYTQIAKYKEM